MFYLVDRGILMGLEKIRVQEEPDRRKPSPLHWTGGSNETHRLLIKLILLLFGSSYFYSGAEEEIVLLHPSFNPVEVHSSLSFSDCLFNLT